MSMFNYNTAIGKITDNQNSNKVSDEQANKIAKDMMVSGQSPKVSESMSLDLMPSYVSPMPVQSKDVQPVKTPSAEIMPQSPQYNASNATYSETVGFDSSDIYVSLKDNDAFVPQVAKMAQAPVVASKESKEPEAFVNDNLMSY